MMQPGDAATWRCSSDHTQVFKVQLIVPIDRGRLIDLAYRPARRPLLTYDFRKVQKAKKALKYNPLQKNFLTNF